MPSVKAVRTSTPRPTDRGIPKDCNTVCGQSRLNGAIRDYRVINCGSQHIQDGLKPVTLRRAAIIAEKGLILANQELLRPITYRVIIQGTGRASV